MVNRPSRFTPSPEQGQLVEQARKSLDELVYHLVKHSDADTPAVRELLDVKGDSRFGKDFKCDRPGNHAAIAARAFERVAKLSAKPGWSEPYRACEEPVLEALRCLNEVLSAFGKAPLPFPAVFDSVSPFEPIDENLWHFKRHGAVRAHCPQPRFEDFSSGEVVESRADDILEQLEARRVCYLRGISSFGKTTAAFVVAFRQMSHGFAAHYIDLSETSDGLEREVAASFRLLSGRGARQIIIIDNAHRHAGLVRNLRSQWDLATKASRPLLLIVGTQISYAASTPSHEVMLWPEGETFDFKLTSANFRDIARFYVKRESGRLIELPDLVQHNWTRVFANHLHAFTFALLARAQTVGKGGNWALDIGHALEWIDQNWLHRKIRGAVEPVDPLQLNDLFAICVFAEQDLELALQRDAFPRQVPSLTHFRTLGVVKERVRMRAYLAVGTKRPKLAAFDTVFQLMEHGWGELILQAANLSEADRSTIRTTVLQRSLNAALAAANRYRDIGRIEKLRRLFLELQSSQDLLPRLAAGQPGQINGWLSVLLGFDSGIVGEFFDLVVANFQRNPSGLEHFEFGQLAWFAEQLQNTDTPELYDSLIALLSKVDPNPDSALLQNATFGISADHLKLFAVLPSGSPCRAGLAKAVQSNLPHSLSRMVRLGFQPLVELLGGIEYYVPEYFDFALDELERPENHPRLLAAIAKAKIGEYFSATRFVHNGSIIHERAVGMFFSRFARVDWQQLIAAQGGQVSGAHWMVKALRHINMQEEATGLADLLAARAEQSDLYMKGHRGAKRIEMIAQVCRNCSDPDLSRRYFEAMASIVAVTLGDRQVYRGLIAAGLGVLSSCDHVDVNLPAVREAVQKRLSQLGGVCDPSPQKAAHAVAEYVRMLGSIHCIWPAHLFATEVLRFIETVGEHRLLSNSMMDPAETDPLSDYMPMHHAQYWQGLNAIVQVTGRPLPVAPDLIRRVRTLWQGNLDYVRTVARPSAKDVRRAEAFAKWLDACLDGKPILLVQNETPLTGE